MMADAIGSEFDIDDDDAESPAQGDPKALRDAYKAQTKALKELQSKFNELSTAQRKSTVADLMKDRNVPEKAAGLYSGDATPEALDAWLGEYGELVGYKPTDVQGTTTSSDETVTAAQRMQQAAAASQTQDPPSNDQAAFALDMRNANSRESIDAVYAKYGFAPATS